MPNAQPELISSRDLFQAITLLMIAPVALFVPVARWPQSCRAYARLGRIVPVNQVKQMAATLARFAQHDGPGASSADAYGACLEMYWENRLQIVDQTLLNRWRPRIGLSGQQHLNVALGAGRGAILWVTPFAYSDLVVKIGLAQGGYKIAHLSRPEHGFSTTRTGMATLNRLRTRIEDRYLHERVKIDQDQEQRATLALRRIVKKNGIVSITVGSQTKSPERVGIGDGELSIATGAVRLAQLTGAPLIPVFGVKRSALDFRVCVESPLELADTVAPSALEQYARLLLRYIERYPYQWRATSDFTSASTNSGCLT